MKKHLLDIPLISIGGSVSKAESTKGLSAYVNDDLEKLEPLVGIVPHRFLFSQGYNEGVGVGSVAQRVKSWQDLYQKLSEIENNS